MPDVSVIIPTYKRPEYLRRAIESVAGQTYRDWEILVVGRTSGPEDPTHEVVREFAQKRIPLRYLEQKNTSVSAARNMGIAQGAAKYVAFLDDDDEWLPHKLEAQVSFLDSHPEIGLVYGRIEIHRFTDGVLQRASLLPKNQATDFAAILNCWITPTTVMIRRSCLENSTWFDPRYVIGEDWELWLRFSQRWKIAALSEAVARTVKDGHESLTADSIKSAQQGLEILKNLELRPSHACFGPLVVKNIARLNYHLGREYFAVKKYRAAAHHFTKALAIHPFVGLMFGTGGESGLQSFLRVMKSYLSVPWCLVKGLTDRER